MATMFRQIDTEYGRVEVERTADRLITLTVDRKEILLRAGKAREVIAALQEALEIFARKTA